MRSIVLLLATPRRRSTLDLRFGLPAIAGSRQPQRGFDSGGQGIRLAGTPLPQPVASDGFRQKLKIRLAAPIVTDAPLFVWLRDEPNPRATSARPN